MLEGLEKAMSDTVYRRFPLLRRAEADLLAHDLMGVVLQHGDGEVAAELDCYRGAIRVFTQRLADLLHKSYGLAIDSDQDWVRAHIGKTNEAVNAALTSRASGEPQ